MKKIILVLVSGLSLVACDGTTGNTGGGNAGGGTSEPSEPKQTIETVATYTDPTMGLPVKITSYNPRLELHGGSFRYASRVDVPSGNRFTAQGVGAALEATKNGATKYCGSLGKSTTSDSKLIGYDDTYVRFGFNCG